MVVADPLWLNANDGAPEYGAAELRRAFATLLLPGVADRFGARPGIRPGGGPAVTLAGTTWTVQHATAVVYPGLSSTAGPYLVQLPAQSGALAPADGSNPRRDILVLRVYDDDEDTSGRREAVIEYITGTPAASPAAPATPAGALRLASVLVPTGGSATLTVEAPFTVASGGVLPVRTAAELPAAGLYDGMTAWVQDQAVSLVSIGGQWRPLPGWTPISSGTFSGVIAQTIDATRGGLFPAGTFERMRLTMRGALDATGNVHLRVNNDDTSTLYLRNRVTRRASDDAIVSVDNFAATSSFVLAQWGTPGGNELEVLLLPTDTNGLVTIKGTGQRISATDTAYTDTKFRGRLNDNRLVSSLRVLTSSGAIQFSSTRFWLEGYRS